MNAPGLHTFHIPVMGLSYTIDSPIRVGHFGIDSVVSIVDDELAERLRKFYSELHAIPFEPISSKAEDSRARRITAYLDLMDDLVEKRFATYIEELISSRASLEHFLMMLPRQSAAKTDITDAMNAGNESNLRAAILRHLRPGAIDVNIMTKVDKVNFRNGEPLPFQHNDAHSALRGYANSNLTSALVLSAGMNPSLFQYMASFDDFFPQESGTIRKKVILKVSDFRSAMVQGNILAKKGIWVSEYRIESGLNCGGHAFATDGLLLGPILQEFLDRKDELISGMWQYAMQALQNAGKPVPSNALPVRITVQGGVGTAEEHQFLIDRFKVDAVGWGSPFLLVPEATSTDAETRRLLAEATEADLYRSDLSPLGVPFNTVRNTSNDQWRTHRIKKGRAGSACPKKLLALHQEFGPEGVCTASRKYQEHKLDELEALKDSMTAAAYRTAKDIIEVKACLCVGLANATYIEKGIELKGEQQGVVVCPGPNMAYFDREVSLLDMVRHIYGYHSVIGDRKRPNMFMKELELYFDYLMKDALLTDQMSKAQLKKFGIMKQNLLEGIQFYYEMFAKASAFMSERTEIGWALDHFRQAIAQLGSEVPA